ncbi:MAG TPA: GerAB/ArcD/ProY family transporter [Firmicutes bacterium]|nr:GerAB/ArcD/ProY family transporter [Bacillota bacterium]
MEKTVKISAWQLMSLLLVSRVAVALTYTGGAAGVAHGTDRMASLLLEAGLLLLLFLPTLWYIHAAKGISSLEYAYVQFGRGGAVVAVFYALYCLYIQSLDLIQFDHFASTAMSPDIPRVLLCIALVAAAFVAAFYGLEAVARTAAVIAFFMVLAIVFLGLSLIPDMKALNFPPLLYNGAAPVINGALENLPRFLELGVIALLVPYVKGVSRGYSFGILAAAALVLVMQVTLVGVLGDYSEMVTYPYYTAVTIVHSSMLQRLDILVAALWMAGIFVKMSFLAVLFLGCLRQAFGDKLKVLYVAAGGIAVLTVGLLFGDTLLAAEHGFLWLASTILLLLFAVALPVVLLAANAWRVRRRQRKGESL